MAGKGDTRRPAADEKKLETEWSRIFPPKKQPTSTPNRQESETNA